MGLSKYSIILQQLFYNLFYKQMRKIIWINIHIALSKFIYLITELHRLSIIICFWSVQSGITLLRGLTIGLSSSLKLTRCRQMMCYSLHCNSFIFLHEDICTKITKEKERDICTKLNSYIIKIIIIKSNY